MGNSSFSKNFLPFFSIDKAGFVQFLLVSKAIRENFSQFFDLFSLFGVDKSWKWWALMDALGWRQFILQNRNQEQNSLKPFHLSFTIMNTSSNAKDPPPPAALNL